jgi:tetratricopeptide (TPR) repeat protein
MMNEQGNNPKFNQDDAVKDPTVFKAHSAEELQQLIKHPDTPEDIWVKACNELSELGVPTPYARTNKPIRINQVRIATIVSGLLLIAGVLLSVPLFEQTINTKPAINKVPTAIQEAENKVRRFTDKIEKNPNDVGAYQNRALAYSDLAKYDLSIGDSTMAMQLDPSRPGPILNRAAAHRLAGQLELALKDCNLLIEKFPKYAHGYAERAQVYADMGKYPLAAKDVSKAIDLDPSRPGYYVNRENVYKKLGEKDHFKAAEVDPGYYQRRKGN